MAGLHLACYTQIKYEFHFKCLCDAALIQLEMAVVMRGRGDRTKRKGRSTVETVDEIHAVHDTLLTERLSASRELFFGRLEISRTVPQTSSGWAARIFAKVRRTAVWIS